MDRVFEIAMLTAFSTSWLASILHLVITGSSAGKSLPFIAMSATGCAAGIAAKYTWLGQAAFLEPVVWLLGFNMVMALLDLCLTLRLRGGGLVRRSRTGSRS